jgi:hypothetical protein
MIGILNESEYTIRNIEIGIKKKIKISLNGI